MLSSLNHSNPRHICNLGIFLENLSKVVSKVVELLELRLLEQLLNSLLVFSQFLGCRELRVVTRFGTVKHLVVLVEVLHRRLDGDGVSIVVEPGFLGVHEEVEFRVSFRCLLGSA